MSFTVDHNAVRAFAANVDGLTDDADAAVRYAQEHLGIGYDKGRMFFTVVETATTVRDALLANYRALERLADASGQELVKAADDYRDTDQATAARLDNTY